MSANIPLESLSYDEIIHLPPNTIVNPTYEPEYQINLAEALCLSSMFTKTEIPDEVVKHLQESNRINSRELAEQADQWNRNFAFTGMINAIHEIAAGSLVRTIRRMTPTTYSEVKQIQVIAAAHAISYSYIISQ